MDGLLARRGGGDRSAPVTEASAAFTEDGRELERPRVVSCACDADFLWLRRLALFTKLLASSLLSAVMADVKRVCWAFWMAERSFKAAPVTAGAGVRAFTKKLFMMIVLCGVE